MIEVLRQTLCRDAPRRSLRPGDPYDDGHANRFRLGRVLRGLGLCIDP
jgi:hypothetical protein